MSPPNPIGVDIHCVRVGSGVHILAVVDKIVRFAIDVRATAAVTGMRRRWSVAELQLVIDRMYPGCTCTEKVLGGAWVLITRTSRFPVSEI